MKLKHILGIVIAASVLSACNPNSSTSPAKTDVSLADLTHHRFELVEFNGEALNVKQTPVIEFNEGNTITGSMCNRFNGKFTLENNVVKSSQLAMTRMMCPEEIRNKLDFALSDILNKGATVTLNQGKLTFTNGETNLIFQQKDLVN